MTRLAYTPDDAARSLDVVTVVTFRTRYGDERHHHRDGDVHVAGPTCKCKPEIVWRNQP